MREDARKFAGHLVRTCGDQGAAALVDKAKEKRPADPRAYIIAMLKTSVATLSSQTSSQTGFGSTSRCPTVRATQRPDPARITKLIGWENKLISGIRHKLYRMPDGRLKRDPPDQTEQVPTFAEIPGFAVID